MLHFTGKHYDLALRGVCCDLPRPQPYRNAHTDPSLNSVLT